MLNSDTRVIIAAAFMATLLFFVVTLLGLGFLFFFLPSLPLFYAGLQRGQKVTFAAAALSTLMLAASTGSAVVGATFFVLIAMPSCYIVRLSLQSGEDGAPFRLGHIWFNLTLYACCAMALMTGFYAFQDENLPQIMSRMVVNAFASFPVEYAPVVDGLASRSFLILSITVWLWAIALYAHAWLANSWLIRQGKEVRSHMAFEPFTLPNWIFSLIAICALASLIGGESMRFLGKTLLIILAMPYFFLGAAHVHKSSADSPNRKFFLFLLYFLVAAQLWPALCIAAWGFWQHLKSANKHLPERGA